jgi:hypothetical protein
MALQHSFSFTGIKSISGDGFFLQCGEESVSTDVLYVKVANTVGTKQNLTASVNFIDQQLDKLVAHKQYEFPLNLDGPNPIKQAYLYLKTLPEFSGATDC